MSDAESIANGLPEEAHQLFEEACKRGDVVVGHDELTTMAMAGDSEPNFRRDLAALLNKHSRENGSNTPDFILANYLVACLAAYDTASRSREEWYGEHFAPGQRSETEIERG